MIACGSETTSTTSGDAATETSTAAETGTSPAACPGGAPALDASVAACKVDGDCEIRATCCEDRKKYPTCPNVDPGNCRAVPKARVEVACETQCNNIQSPCASVLSTLGADAAAAKLGARCDNGTCTFVLVPL